MTVSTRPKRNGTLEIYPKFIIKKSKDLMIRGSDFYAIWLEEQNRWSTDEGDAIEAIDKELTLYFDEHKKEYNFPVHVLYMWDSESGIIDAWHKYVQKQCRDNFKMLDEQLIFSNTEPSKENYSSKNLPYPLQDGDHSAYDNLMSTLYSDEDRHKIEWCIGAIVTGDSKHLQKFAVLYGPAGSGKSTVLKIIEQLFAGYLGVFDARALGSSTNVFALEAFKNNPLVAIQHDGDLSRIEDNTKLNSLVSHEMMTINEKYRSTYTNSFKAFLFMGTNKPVKITDAKSGLIRRLIDISPTGNTMPLKLYRKLMKKIPFELSGIAWHCKEVYEDDPNYYANYIPINMLGATNDFYNFIEDRYFTFKESTGVSLNSAYEMYKIYCEDAGVVYKLPKRIFKEELKNYFGSFQERATIEGARVWNYYSDFKEIGEKKVINDISEEDDKKNWIHLSKQHSLLDDILKDCPAQYANEEGTPSKAWDNVKTKLADIDTGKQHYVLLPSINYIFIDFDLKDKNGNKSLELNLAAAEQFPKTYAETSKSGQGLHLHYIYTGDVTKLALEYSENIEIKVLTGKSALRRCLTICNDIPIAEISSGLPLRKERSKKMDLNGIKSESHLRNMIKKNLCKEFLPSTKSSIDFIKKLIDEAIEANVPYDISDMAPALINFAANSTNQASYCIDIVNSLQLSNAPNEIDDGSVTSVGDKLIFYDTEVFPNLFVICYKFIGDDNVFTLINPSPEEVESFIKKGKLIDFNGRNYDRHILYGRLNHYSNEQLYHQSKRIIDGDKTARFLGANNLAYLDLYEVSTDKKSLKKWEIALGIHHKELGLPWDKPVETDMFETVAKYCENDVKATEAVYNAIQDDISAREILAAMAHTDVGKKTNYLTAKIIFGNERHPQREFHYRNLGDEFLPEEYEDEGIDVQCFNYEDAIKSINCIETCGKDACDCTDKEFIYGRMPYFPGYSYEYDPERQKYISRYRDTEVGEGGYVYSKPGIYFNVSLNDIASMHPSSIIAERLFGAYTDIFQELVKIRIAIKHGDYDYVRQARNGMLARYLTDESSAKGLSKALKIPINSVYGLTSASFDNAFRDRRNVDNIVAKRGALFMVDLLNAVTDRGYSVIHIKTDSIKIAQTDPSIEKFVERFGKCYGYNFELEAQYKKLCLVDKANYIAQDWNGHWTATGDKFKTPYIFKALFTKEEIIFKDLIETKEVKSAIYLDFNENLPDVSELEKALDIYDKNLDDIKTKKGKALWEEVHDIYKTREELEKEVSKGHNYVFIGKVGAFVPVKEGTGGGILLRTQIDKSGKEKFYAVESSSGYRWKEAEVVESLNLFDDICKDYYSKIISDAQAEIDAIGGYDYFMNAEPMRKKQDDIPPWVCPCGENKYETCMDCPNWDSKSNKCHLGYECDEEIILKNDI